MYLYSLFGTEKNHLTATYRCKDNKLLLVGSI